MAKLYITEFSDFARLQNAGAQPWGALQSMIGDQTPISFSTSTQSVAFNAATRFIRVHTDAICSIAYGSNPTATTGNMRLAAGQTEYFAVKGGDMLAVVSNT